MQFCTAGTAIVVKVALLFGFAIIELIKNTPSSKNDTVLLQIFKFGFAVFSICVAAYAYISFRPLIYGLLFYVVIIVGFKLSNYGYGKLDSAYHIEKTLRKNKILDKLWSWSIIQNTVALVLLYILAQVGVWVMNALLNSLPG